jgi:pimeloyl-ACP methyl ester carboxylesterase
VPGIGVELVAETRGAGPDLVLVHGMASDHLAMLERFAPLTGEARLVAYARRGYGGSGVPEPYQGTTVPEQGEDAAAALRALDARGAVGAGDGFGALVVLDLLLRHRGLLRGAVLVDPPLYALAPDATRALADAAAELQLAVAERGPRAGVDAWLAARLDGPERERALEAHVAFFADYAGLATLAVTRADLRAVDVPVVLVTGPRSPAAEVESADALATLIPGARRSTDGDPVAAARSLL